MTTVTHPEAQIAANQTRELWREYQRVTGGIVRHSNPMFGDYANSAACVGRVVRLLREQHRILTEILGGDNAHNTETTASR